MQTTDRPILHEVFCLPTGDREEVRVEGFVAYQDDVYGRSIPSANVTRCLECGATSYEPFKR